MTTAIGAKACRIDDCSKPACPRNPLCSMHNSRAVRYGDPLATPWLYVDDHDVRLVVVDRRPAPGLNRLEKRAAAWRLTDEHVSAEEIARLLAVTPRTVHRWRGQRPARTAVHPTVRKAC
jgi:hypothetical protein